MEKCAPKRLLYLLIAVSYCMLVFDNVVYANTLFIAEITVDALNVRDQPSTEGNVIGKLNKGEQVTASPAQWGCAKTLFHEETPGYFSTNYMKIIRVISSDESSTLDRDRDEEGSFTLDGNENIVYAKFIAEITVDALNVTDQPSTEGNVIGKLNKGEQVTASPAQSGWAITLFHGETPGYFSTDYMKVIRVVYSEGLYTLGGQEEEIKCNAESAKLDLGISNIDFKCKENLINERYKSCSAWFNVAVSSDCNERMSAIVDCEAEFKLETEDGVEPYQVSESGLGTIYLNYGRGNGKIKVNWQSGVILAPEINVQVNNGSCSIISGYDIKMKGE